VGSVATLKTERGSGMKTLTKHRELVFQDIKEREDHPTAKMVFDSVKEKSGRISFATVYNSLEFLVQKNMIRKVNMESLSVRYDGRMEAHSHLICEKCGRISDTKILDLAPGYQNDLKGFQPREIEVNLLGLCETCIISP